MNLAHINLSNLVISPVNMRAKRKDRDIADLIPSVRARGVLVPILVRPNGTPDTYEIIAGRRRYFAAKAVAESSGEPMTLPCAIVEAGDDAAALEASLLENIARLEADEVSQWETFALLVKKGRSVEDIAATFGLADAVVRRVLALGNLLPRIRALYRTEQIDVGSVRQLTMATTAKQREWLALFDSEEERAPTGRLLKNWLFGGAAIPTSAALFDLSCYTAPIVSDLFGEHSYFSDSALFWTHQAEALEAKKLDYLANGWSEVVVVDDGRWFDRWSYEKRSKAKGGRVYVVVDDGGAVEVHEGFVPRKEAERLDRKDNGPSTVVRPELTAPLRRYVELHRHAAARATLLDHPSVALRLMLAHVIAGSALWTVRVERQYADKEETVQSLGSSLAQATFDAKRSEALVLLGLDPDTVTLVGRGCVNLAVLVETMLALDDAAVLQLLPIVMGETLDAGEDVIELLGNVLSIDMAAVWEADEAFFALSRDRKLLCEIVAEIAGPQVAHANSDASTKVLKAIVRDCLTGQNGRAKVDHWVPRWLRFPSSSYFGEAEAQLEPADALRDGAPIDAEDTDHTTGADEALGSEDTPGREDTIDQAHPAEL